MVPHIFEGLIQKNVCIGCNKDQQDKLKTCGRCRVVRYCSKECQTKHWPEHKPYCEITAENKNTAKISLFLHENTHHHWLIYSLKETKKANQQIIACRPHPGINMLRWIKLSPNAIVYSLAEIKENCIPNVSGDFSISVVQDKIEEKRDTEEKRNNEEKRIADVLLVFKDNADLLKNDVFQNYITSKSQWKSVLEGKAVVVFDVTGDVKNPQFHFYFITQLENGDEKGELLTADLKDMAKTARQKDILAFRKRVKKMG